MVELLLIKLMIHHSARQGCQCPGIFTHRREKWVLYKKKLSFKKEKAMTTELSRIFLFFFYFFCSSPLLLSDHAVHSSISNPRRSKFRSVRFPSIYCASQFHLSLGHLQVCEISFVSYTWIRVSQPHYRIDRLSSDQWCPATPNVDEWPSKTWSNHARSVFLAQPWLGDLNMGSWCDF